MYSDHSYCNSKEQVTVTQQTVEGFEIRLQNDYDNERLELTQTLDEALTYLKRYSMHHEDLFVYDLSTGMQVASSNNGTGAIYSGANWIALVAQWSEQGTHNPLAEGSNPSRRTKFYYESKKRILPTKRKDGRI